MSKAIDKLLDFKANNIRVKETEDGLYINVKDVCRLIGVTGNSQEDILYNDTSLKMSLKYEPKDGLYIEEVAFYGWLLNIESDSKELHVYKMKCHQVLYEALSPNFRK